MYECTDVRTHEPYLNILGNYCIIAYIISNLRYLFLLVYSCTDGTGLLMYGSTVIRTYIRLYLVYLSLIGVNVNLYSILGVNVRMYGWTDVSDVRMYRCTDVRMYGCTDVRTYGCTDARMYGCTDVRM